jgi:pyridoxal phosphate enzyme (YggS family)
MSTIARNLKEILRETGETVTLVAVSKTHPVEAIREAYRAGQRVFGENKVQEMVAKQPHLPADVQWHLIGHLQTNKVKYIAPFVSMIQSVDSYRLLKEISKEAVRNDRRIDCLLEIFIASEETKFGLDPDEAEELVKASQADPLPGVRVCGVMGMASFTPDRDKVKREFRMLRDLFEKYRVGYFSDEPAFRQISMGMSGDYDIAIGEGSTIVRIGTRIFGTR